MQVANDQNTAWSAWNLIVKASLRNETKKKHTPNLWMSNATKWADSRSNFKEEAWANIQIWGEEQPLHWQSGNEEGGGEAVREPNSANISDL